VQVCVSNGKYVRSTGQMIDSDTGGFHETEPSEETMAGICIGSVVVGLILKHNNDDKIKLRLYLHGQKKMNS
jgi:hypothetical protein